MKSITIFGKKVPTAVLAIALVTAGVGATAGAAASGNIAGDGTTNVEQSLLIAENDGISIEGGAGTAQVADDRTAFTFGTQVFQGGTQNVDVTLENQAESDLSARLVTDIEEPLRLEVTSSNSNIEVTRVSPSEFILTAESNLGGNNPALEITIHAPNDANPDFYEFEFRLEPVDVSDEVRSDE